VEGLEALRAPGEGAPDPGFIAQVFDAVNAGWAAGFAVASGFLVVAALVAVALVRVSKEAAARALKESGAAAG
jgi:threonine/homoserine/homoserine lactone efflux protein